MTPLEHNYLIEGTIWYREEEGASCKLHEVSTYVMALSRTEAIKLVFDGACCDNWIEADWFGMPRARLVYGH